jgi:lipopolysaccharide transport system permease protein
MNLHLLKLLVEFDLRKRYVTTRFGLWWTFLAPLLLVSIFTLVFATLLKVSFKGGETPLGFALYLVCGALPWITIQETLSRAVTVLPDHAALIRNEPVPGWLFPTKTTIANHINGLITLALFLPLVWFFGGGPRWTQLLLPVLMLAQFTLTLGLALLFSALHARFRDTEHVVRNGLMVWMFVTPIFYPSGSYPEAMNVLLIANPLAHLVDLYRATIVNGTVPLASLATLTAFAIGYFALGWFAFSRVADDLPDLV